MKNMRHRYAAILAADVDHFSTRMEDDAEATVRALQTCRELFRQCIEQHGGREFGSVGDSLMAEFPSAVSALRAARDFQDEDHLQVRIGLHAGDVVAEGDGTERVSLRAVDPLAPGNEVLLRVEVTAP